MKIRYSHEIAQELLSLPNLPILHYDPSFEDACDEEYNHTLGTPIIEVIDASEGLSVEQIDAAKSEGIYVGKFISLGGSQDPELDLKQPLPGANRFDDL